jgi:hypothetical protein
LLCSAQFEQSQAPNAAEDRNSAALSLAKSTHHHARKLLMQQRIVEIQFLKLNQCRLHFKRGWINAKRTRRIVTSKTVSWCDTTHAQAPHAATHL